MLSSKKEALPLVAIESLAWVLLQLLLIKQGMKEILRENNENALIVENNTDALFEGIKEILTNEGFRKKYKKKT